MRDWEQKPITKKQWEDLTPKGRWDVMAALRGPDFARSALLKWMTTAVIRGTCREAFRVGGIINPHPGFILLPRVWVHASTEGYSHFEGHITDAAIYLRLPVFSVKISALDITRLSPDQWVERIENADIDEEDRKVMAELLRKVQ